MAAGDRRGTAYRPAHPRWAFLNVPFSPTQINTSIHNDDECPPKAKNNVQVSNLFLNIAILFVRFFCASLSNTIKLILKYLQCVYTYRVHL